LKSQQIVKGGVLAAGVTGTTVLVNLLLTPFLIRTLGAEAYGVWALVLSISVAQGILGFLDLGILSSVVKLVAQYRAQENIRALNGIVSAALFLFLFISSAIAILLVFARGRLVEDLFRIPNELVAIASLLLVMLAIQVVVDAIRMVMTSVLQGFQEFVLFKSFLLLHTLLYVGALMVLVYFGYGLYGLGIASLFASVVHAGCAILAARHFLEGWRLWALPALPDVRGLVKLSSIILFIRIQGAIFRGMDRILLGVFTSAVVVTQYDIMAKLAGLGVMCITIVSGLVFAPASESKANDNLSGLRSLCLNSTKYSLILCLPVLLVLFLFAEEILSLWVGDEYRIIANLVRLFLFHILFVAIIASGQNILIGADHSREVAIISIITTALNLAISLLLIGPYGMLGVILGTVISFSVASVLYWREFARIFSLKLRDLWSAIVRPLGPPLAGAYMTHWLLGLLGGGHQNLHFAITSMGILLVYGILTLWLTLSASEIKQLRVAFSFRKA
jgi:O-antigen/teichoic acid export membrane protein